MDNNKEISLRLRTINHSLRRFFDGNSEIMKEFENLTCSNKWIMGYLFDAQERGIDVFQRDFENNFGITRSTVSKMLTLLEKKKLVQRVSVSHDARLKKIVLTEKSRYIAEAMHKTLDEIETCLKSGFSDEELLQLSGYLERIQNNLDSADKNEKRAEKRGRKND